MAIPKGKERITITIHNETKKLLDELLSLHNNYSYSNIIELAIYTYASMVASKLDDENAKGEN